MNRQEFMKQLEVLLSDISQAERDEALQYYNDYLDDAGMENEEDAISTLGFPAQVAANIKEGLKEGGDAGEFTEKGFQMDGEGNPSAEAASFTETAPSAEVPFSVEQNDKIVLHLDDTFTEAIQEGFAAEKNIRKAEETPAVDAEDKGSADSADVRQDLSGQQQEESEQEQQYQDSQYKNGQSRENQYQNSLYQGNQYQGTQSQNGQYQETRNQNGQYQGTRNQNGQYQGTQNQNGQYQGNQYQNSQYQGTQNQDSGYQGNRSQNSQYQGTRNQNSQYQGTQNQDSRYQGNQYQGNQQGQAYQGSPYPNNNQDPYQYQNTYQNQYQYQNQYGSSYNTYGRPLKKRRTTGEIILFVLLCIFALPIVVPIGIAVLAVVFSLVVAVVAVLGSLVIAGLVVLVVGVVLVIEAFTKLFLFPAGAIYLLGGGLICTGIGLAMTAAMIWVVAKVVPVVCSAFVKLCRLPFTRKNAV